MKKIHKTALSYCHSGSISRRNLLKFAGMAGVMATFPFPWIREAFAVSPAFKQDDLIRRAFDSPDWMVEARIFGLAVTGLKVDQVRLGMDLDSAIKQGANVIEADSRLSDYISDQEFETEQLLIKDTARMIHERGMKVVWYIPSLEVITPDGRLRKDTMARQHPDWLQLSFDRKRRGVFYGQKEFWVEPNDESAWLCPNSPYREWLHTRLRGLAATGVDGIWLDVPLFGLLIALWGCACGYCQEKFARQTGMEFPDKFDMTDAKFWRYVQWRHETLTEFMESCRKIITEVNPNAVTIAEVVALDHLGATEWGTEGSAMSTHFVAWEMDGVSEVTGMAEASYDDWVAQYSGYKYCRGATMDRPSWAFSYGFNDPDAQLVMAGAIAAQNNPYELRTPKMTTTVGMEFRGMMYNWIADHSKLIFRSKSLASVAVIYSERNRDFIDTPHEGGKVISGGVKYRDRVWLGKKEETPIRLEYMGDYRGLSLMLYQNQIPTDIYPFSRVDEDLLSNYSVLVLPFMASLTAAEKRMLLRAVRNGAILIVTGSEPGMWDADGNKRNQSLWSDIISDSDKTQAETSLGKGKVFFWQDSVGQQYLKTHDDELTQKMQAWVKEGGVEPWVSEKLPVVIQPYVYEKQIIIHVLNYSWIGKLSNQPRRLKLELSVPWVADNKIVQVMQSEPQWSEQKLLTFTNAGDKVSIPIEVGINAVVIIDLA